MDISKGNLIELLLFLASIIILARKRLGSGVDRWPLKMADCR
jgi:hypothetical protein